MRVTVVTCTPDIMSTAFARHVRALKEHTRDLDWLVLDNHNDPHFNHAHDINRAASIATGELLVTLDDDVLVGPGWLDGLLTAARTADIVGGIHRYENGEINHSGGYVLSDGSAGHCLGALKAPRYVQYVCSAVMLINLSFLRRHHIYCDESYLKFFHDTDLCLRAWEAHGRVIVTNQCDVIHLVGQATERRSRRQDLYSRDNDRFRTTWIHTSRLSRLMTSSSTCFDVEYTSSLSAMSRFWSSYRKAVAEGDEQQVLTLKESARVVADYEHGRRLLTHPGIPLHGPSS